MTHDDIVIVAVDGSPASDNAVRWAANTAMKRGIPLRLAASYTMPQFLYAEGMVPPQEVYDDLQRETLQTVERAREIALQVAPDLRIGHAVAEGSPIDMLLEMSRDCTMIVMGSRGLSGLSGMVLGSVSGTGKSTLFRALAGAWPWGTGRIRVPGRSAASRARDGADSADPRTASRSTPSIAAGVADRGEIRDPTDPNNGQIEIRTGIAAAYEFSNDWRLGATYFHVTNPAQVGTSTGDSGEVLNFTLAVPFGGK